MAPGGLAHSDQSNEQRHGVYRALEPTRLQVAAVVHGASKCAPDLDAVTRLTLHIRRCPNPANRAKTLHTVSSAEWSYIDFGPFAVLQAKATEAVALPVGIVERDVQSDVVRGVLYVGTLGLFDIDRIRLLINNVHLELKDISKWEA